MNRNGIIAVAALAVVLLLAGCTGQQQDNGAMSNGGDQEQVSCSGVQEDTHTVTYSGDGFSPQQITIRRCDTVIWENEGGGDVWIASDVHPTHTEYDGSGLNQHCPGSESFDQCEAGSSYSFTFEKVGEWGYHNHALAGHGGTVIVNPR